MEIIGGRYGRLTQVSKSGRNSRKDFPKAFFMCDCGKIISVNKNVVLKYNLFDKCTECKNEIGRKLINNSTKKN